MWWDYSFGWGGWLMMTLGMGGFWILLIALVVVLLRNGGSRGDNPDAREILEQRLARGEIDVAEYEQRREAMTQARQ
jgi:putative membrane protein